MTQIDKKQIIEKYSKITEQAYLESKQKFFYALKDFTEKYNVSNLDKLIRGYKNYIFDAFPIKFTEQDTLEKSHDWFVFIADRMLCHLKRTLKKITVDSECQDFLDTINKLKDNETEAYRDMVDLYNFYTSSDSILPKYVTENVTLTF